jgi:hypothetical protein
MNSGVGEIPAKGLRAWTPGGLKAHGLNKADIPPETGGNIIFQDQEDKVFAVQWDTGTITVHSVFEFAKELVCIGTCANLNDYLDSSKKGKEK